MKCTRSHKSSSSSSSQISTVAIQSIVDKLRSERCRDSTRKKILDHMEDF